MVTYDQRIDSLQLQVAYSPWAVECYWDEFLTVETTAGDEMVPVDVVHGDHTADSLQDCTEGRILHIGESICRWVARLTMPGYLDTADCVFADTQAEALIELYSQELGELLESWQLDCLQLLAELADTGDTVASKFLDAELVSLQGLSAKG